MGVGIELCGLQNVEKLTVLGTSVSVGLFDSVTSYHKLILSQHIQLSQIGYAHQSLPSYSYVGVSDSFSAAPKVPLCLDKVFH